MANISLKILVIDDRQDDLISFNALIKQAFPDANVLMAQSGKAGLELAAKENPTLILLDILMPGMDGYEVCQKLKADKELCDIPVVFVTAIENTKEALAKALESGGEAFIKKPIDEIELTAQISSTLKIKEANEARKNEKFRLEKLAEERNKELVQELDAHKKTLQELRIKEAEKSSILQTAIDGFWIVDKQGKFIEVNDAACKMIGYSKEEMLEMSIPDIEAKETAIETAEHIKTIIKEGSARFETKHRTKKGRIIDVEVSTTWMNSQNIFFSFLNDITDRKRFESILQQTLDGQNLNIALLDSHGKIIFVNEAWRKFAEANNSSAENVSKGVNYLEVCNRAAKDGDPIAMLFADNFRKLISGVLPSFEFEYSCNSPKKERYFMCSVSRIAGFDMLSVVVSHQDITERKLAEEALKESEERFRMVLQGSSIIVASFDNDLRYTWIHNPHPDFNTSEVLGKRDNEIDDNEGIRRLIDLKQRTIDTGLPQSAEITFPLSAEDKTYAVNVRPVMGDNGTIIGGKSVSFDITERKQAEESLIASEKLLSTIAENFPSSYLSVINNDFTIGLTSGQELKKQNIDTKEFEGLKLEQVFGDKTEFILEKYKRTFHGEELTFEMFFNNQYQLYKTVPLYTQDGSITRILAVVENITERREWEKKLLESENKYRHLFETMTQGVVIQDVEGKIIEANSAAADILGVTEDQLYGRTAYDPRWKLIREDGSPYDPSEMPSNIVLRTGKPVKDVTCGIYVPEKDKYRWIIIGSAPQFKDNESKPYLTMTVFTDITERKQAEEALKISERKNIAWIENSPVCTKVVDLDFNLQFMSESGIRELKIEDISEYYGKPYPFYFYPESFKIEMKGNLEKAKETGKIITQEASVNDINGKKLWYHSTIVPVNDNEGKLDYLLVVSLETTTRKQAEEELHKSQNLLRNTIDNMQDCVWWKDLDSVFLGCNLGFAKDAGFNHPDQLIGKSDYDMSWKDQADHYVSDDREVIESGIPKIGIKEFQTKPDGDIRWLETSKVPLLNNDGNIIGTVGSYKDITEQKQGKEDLRKSEALKNAMVSNIGDVIVIIDQNEITQYKSPNLTKLFGWAPEELVGESAWNNVHPDDLEAAQKFLRTIAVEPNTTGTTELRYKRKDGNYVWIEITIINLMHDKDVQGLLGNYHDITDRKKAEHELTLAKVKAEESDRLKTAFLNNMSHEIRTPLNGITGFISLLQESEIDDEDKKQFYDIINKSSHRLITTVSDIIDISKIEAGQVQLTNSEVSVNKLLDEQFKFFQREAKYKGLKLYNKNSLTDSESRIFTDIHKLESILTNLLKNAVKFTDSGEISMGCKLKDKANGQFMEFYVKDTGIGVPADRVEAIFNRFEQADIADTRAFEGSGLGLAISKSYVEMLGGEIGVDSIEGSGSTFTFSIPNNKKCATENSSKKNIEEIPGVSLKSLSVIVAEDDETSRMFFEKILKNQFKSVTYTTTGKETIEKLHENPNTDIILMDLKMPDINGYDATREIRKFNSDVIIIAQTAFVILGDKDNALKAGCNDYISKPIKREKLFKKIRACLDMKSIKHKV